MGPWGFPIVAEARMAERLLEVERERMARRAASRPRGGEASDLCRPQAQEGAHRRAPRVRSVSITFLVLATCFAVGGLSALSGGTDPPGGPTDLPTATLVRPALVSGEWLCLHGWCHARLNDPRLSDAGPSLDLAGSRSGDGPVMGTLRLPGPHGDWVGPVATIWDDRTELFTGARQVLGTAGAFALEGRGSYEGWAFVGTWSDPVNGEPSRVSGIIYQGSPEAAVGLGSMVSPCGAPLLGWPIGGLGWSLGRTTVVSPYLAVAACPLP